MKEMEEKRIREKISREYKSWCIFGTAEKHDEWLYFWLLKGNLRKLIRWNEKTDEHEEVMTLD